MASRLVLVLLASICLCATSFARPEFLKTFQQHFPTYKSDCTTCHTKPPDRNTFGKLVEAELDRQKLDAVTPGVLDAVGEMKGKDGRLLKDVISVNGDLLANSESAMAPVTPALNAKPGEVPAAAAPLIPLHSFHPAIVHFPIALLLFAAIMEVLGVKFKKPDLRAGILYAMVFGLLGALASIATGLTALLRIGYGFTGIPLVHLAVAIAGTLACGAATWLKFKNRETALYWIVLLVGAGLLGAAGHFGSLMVYP